jgi:TIR domain
MVQAADFFVSYTSADRAWAEWIAWQLEAEGSQTVAFVRNFINYRLRLLLHCGVTWQTHRTARLRGRSPRLVA